MRKATKNEMIEKLIEKYEQCEVMSWAIYFLNKEHDCNFSEIYNTQKVSFMLLLEEFGYKDALDGVISKAYYTASELMSGKEYLEAMDNYDLIYEMTKAVIYPTLQ